MAALTPHPNPNLDDAPLALSQLSALVDEELEDRETHLLLRRLVEDCAARDRWEDYWLIGDVLRSQEPVPVDTEFAARLRQAIAVEPAPTPLTAPSRRTWGKPVAGLAVAASLALLVWVGWQPGRVGPAPAIEPSLATPMASRSPAPAALVPVAAIPAPEAMLAAYQPTDSFNTAQQNRLKNYFVNHSGYASRSMPGVLPYARMADYQMTDYPIDR